MFHVIEPASSELVTVSELAWNLRLSTDPDAEYTGSDAAFLQRLLSAALEDVENYTGRHFAVKTLEARFRDFERELPLAPNLLEIVQVTYLDNSETEQEQILPTEVEGRVQYLPQHGAARGGIEFRESLVFPSVAQRSDAVRVRFKAGSAPDVDGDATCPEAVKQAMIMIASHWFENREAANMTGGGIEVKPVAQTYEWLLGSYVVPAIG